MRRILLVTLVALVALGADCFGLDSPVAAVPQTAEAFCATAIPDIGNGKSFFCGSSQTNLQNAGKFTGYCNVPNRRFSGTVGYSGHTTNGGIYPVTSSIGEMQTQCNPAAGVSICNGIAQCTRDP